jgi:hypothetical protein
VSSLFGEVPVLQDQYLCRFPHGQKVVRDNDGGPSLHQATHGFHHPLPRLGVEPGGGLVQDEDRGVPDHGPGDGYALPLSPGEEPPLLTHDRVVAFWQRLYELVGVGRLGRPDYLPLGGAGFTVGYVLAHGAVKDERLLQ